MNRIRRSFTLATTALALGVLCGCVGLTGLSGTSQYSCKAPEGVRCDSVSGTYANSLTDNLPSQRGLTTPRREAAPTRREAFANPGAAPAPLVRTALAVPGDPPAAAPAPMRSQARVLRLWVKPWEDSEGDLMDQMYVYVTVDQGRWLVEHAQRRIREGYAPIRAPRATESHAGDAREMPKGDRSLPTTLAQRLRSASAFAPAQPDAKGTDDAE